MDKHHISYTNRLLISDRAHLVTKYQIKEDQALELKQSIGTTKKGVGPTYAAKVQRYGLRVGDLIDWDTFVSKYRKMSTFYSHQR